MEKQEILKRLDHTLLQQTAVWEQIKVLCDEGMEYGTASVCIPPSFVKRAKEYVGDRLAVCTVIGFPNGYMTTAAKVFETEDAVKNGADEIDMVINIGMVKEKDYDGVLAEIRGIKEACRGKLLKVIIETCLLSQEEKVRLCQVVGESGADYIKTSTGFSTGGATFDDVALLRRLCQQAGAELYVAPPVREGEQKVSSTRIRAAVEAGDIPLANRLLGRPFGFSLEVIHGNHIGTGLGTPTINQAIPEGFVLPRFGVYASWCRVGGQFFYGVTNVGVKPTVGSDKVLAETWMPEFSGDLYGKRVRVFLLEFLRPERKFASLEELKAAIQENARQIHQRLHALPEPYREVFTLRVFAELPYTQIGELFGKSENWARVTYYRAKQKIKEGL